MLKSRQTSGEGEGDEGEAGEEEGEGAEEEGGTREAETARQEEKQWTERHQEVATGDSGQGKQTGEQRRSRMKVSQ